MAVQFKWPFIHLISSTRHINKPLYYSPGFLLLTDCGHEKFLTEQRTFVNSERKALVAGLSRRVVHAAQNFCFILPA
jgi:hypothetical protein